MRVWYRHRTASTKYADCTEGCTHSLHRIGSIFGCIEAKLPDTYWECEILMGTTPYNIITHFSVNVFNTWWENWEVLIFKSKPNFMTKFLN